MSGAGNVCKGYSLSKDNTHSTVSSHRSEGLENSREFTEAGRAAMEERTAHDGTLDIGHLRKNGNSETA